MFAYTLLQEPCHLEMWIAKQGWYAYDWSQHLSLERATAVADQQVRLLTIYELTDKANSLFWVHRQIRSKHLHTTLERLAQCLSRHTLAASKESVKEQYLLHSFIQVILMCGIPSSMKESDDCLNPTSS